jgi:hypothetical protein
VTYGRHTKGTFRSFWEGWWGTEGQVIVDANVDRRVRTDVNSQFTRLDRKGGRPKPPERASSSMRAEREKKQAEVSRALMASAARFATRKRT